MPRLDYPANVSEVKAVLGFLDDDLMTAVLAIGATEEELLEARAWIEGDQKELAAAGKAPAGRVADVVELLESINLSED